MYRTIMIAAASCLALSMRTAAIFLALAAGFSVAGVAAAADYYLPSVDEEILNAVDLKTITVNGSIATASTATVMATDNNISAPPTAYVITQEEFDCKERRYRRLYMTAFDIRGDVAAKGKLEGNWQLMTPQSRQEAVWIAVCDPATRVSENQYQTTAHDLAVGYREWVAQEAAQQD